jgi:mono/diheme cytochrome c family protein/glucose/arabinose dehydrogenase
MKTRTIMIGMLSGVSLLGAALWAAPGGDLKQQQPKYHINHIPPAPVLTPEEELKTFTVPPGFKVSLVAAEPMVEEPIALTFDPDGRIYVVELRAYMPDATGKGELDPLGRVVRLDSSGHDGKYDKVTTFLDNLIIPRAVGLAGDGVLVAEPPTVWFCRDTNGDGKCDEKKAIFTDFGSRSPNPEHMANGLTWTLDNWYYNADWGFRFRYSKGQFLRDGTTSHGQWGITADDTGRLFFNSNSSMLRSDVVPSQYMTRNPYLMSPPGLNVAIASNATFPNRVNPGVNRGYTEDVNLEGKLQRVTAACGPLIYRGDNFPPEFQGNAFVCEPAGNLVSRQVLSQDGLKLEAKGVRQQGIDFLTSTDERFRPVSLYNAPDGSMYVVDIYHGILQHKAYLSSYLLDQVKKRNLENNDGHRGRIWKITHEPAMQKPQPMLSKATSTELVKNLSSANGWWRDTSQRLLVERNDGAAAKLLKNIVAGKDSSATPLAKLHALFALQGMERLEDEDTAAALKDADPRVRVAALRTGEMLVRKHTAPETQKAIAVLAKDADAMVQFQVLTMAAPDLPEIQAAALGILQAHADDPIFRAAAIGAAAGRELELLQTLMAEKSFEAAAGGKKELLGELAQCIVRSRSGERLEKLLALVAAQSADAQSAGAMMAGIAEAAAPNGKSKTAPPPRRVRLQREPPALASLLKSPDKKISDAATKLLVVMSWPGKPGDTTPPLKPLTEEQARRFTTGKELFGQICAACHQSTGLGQDGVAPPLVDSEWALGSPERVGRIALNGLHGPIKVGKKTVDMEMPGLKAMDDEQIAAMLTYVRREWGHEASPIDPATIAKIRKETGDRGDLQWTAEELLAIK